MKRHEKADLIGDILDDLYPDPPIPLDHRDPYTLLVAVALSAQTTDKKVNQITPALFAEAAAPAEMVELGPEREVYNPVWCGWPREHRPDAITWNPATWF